MKEKIMQSHPINRQQLITEVEQLIGKLIHEEAYFFFRNRKRKKIDALRKILLKLKNNESNNEIRATILELQKQDEVQAGRFSHRTRDLLNSILERLGPAQTIDSVFPDALIPSISAFLPAKEQGALTQVSHFFNENLKKVNWQKKLKEEITDHPRLSRNESIKSYQALYLHAKDLQAKIKNEKKAAHTELPDGKFLPSKIIPKLLVKVVAFGYEKLLLLFAEFKIDYNMNIEGPNHYWGKLIHLAAMSGNPSTMKLLLDNGARADTRDRLGTPLSIVSAHGYVECMQLLIAHRIDPDIRSSNSFTALHEAAAFGRVKCARLLLEAGADVSIKTKDGETPLDLAPVGSEVWELLRAHHGARGLSGASRRNCCTIL